MASETYKVQYYRYNGTDWDVVYFKTTGDLVADSGTSDSSKGVVTIKQRTAVQNYLVSPDSTPANAFNKPNKLVLLDNFSKIPATHIPTVLNSIITSEIGLTTSAGFTEGGSSGEAFAYGTFYFGVDTGEKLYYEAIPIDNYEVTNKAYVDQLVAQGTKILQTCKTGTFNPITLSGTGQSIEGVNVYQNDRILVMGQTDTTKNGVWTINSSGVWEQEAASKLTGALVSVKYGNYKAGQFYHQGNGVWVEYFVYDDYFGTGAITIDGLEVKIKDGGITNEMISNNANIAISKLGKTQGAPAYMPWELMPASAGSGNEQTLSMWVQTILSAIKYLRGTTNYNTNNTQSIAGAYEAIPKVNIIESSGDFPSDKKTGDICFKKVPLA